MVGDSESTAQFQNSLKASVVQTCEASNIVCDLESIITSCGSIVMDVTILASSQSALRILNGAVDQRALVATLNGIEYVVTQMYPNVGVIVLELSSSVALEELLETDEDEDEFLSHISAAIRVLFGLSEKELELFSITVEMSPNSTDFDVTLTFTSESASQDEAIEKVNTELGVISSSGEASLQLAPFRGASLSLNVADESVSTSTTSRVGTTSDDNIFDDMRIILGIIMAGFIIIMVGGIMVVRTVAKRSIKKSNNVVSQQPIHHIDGSSDFYFADDIGSSGAQRRHSSDHFYPEGLQGTTNAGSEAWVMHKQMQQDQQPSASTFIGSESNGPINFNSGKVVYSPDEFYRVKLALTSAAAAATEADTGHGGGTPPPPENLPEGRKLPRNTEWQI